MRMLPLETVLWAAGQLQRISIARALAHRPAILLFDEALGHIGEGLQAEIIQDIRKELPGITIVAVSHAPSLLVLADRVISLDSYVKDVGALA
ncbi:MAG: hypothetical protein GX060_05455 [Firmicutes bacterium]|nr:hypothetical protein [Bacillota bacterium]